MIGMFRGEFAFLSNFYAAVVVMDGVEYRTLEHAYQAAKSLDPVEREKIRQANTPGQAKRMGRSIGALRPGWNQERLQVMEMLVRDKFSREPLRSSLLNTGNRELAEGNSHGDDFWGVFNGQGANHLGRILMKVRSDLRGS